MNQILIDLCNGNINANGAVDNNEKLQEWIEANDKKRDKLENMLTDEQKRLLDNLLESVRFLHYEREEMFFAEGFKIGTQLMIETLMD